MSSPDYREFDDGQYTWFRRKLIQKDDLRPVRQRHFLEKVRRSEDFVGHLERNVGAVGSEDLAPLADRLSESEFGNSPPDTQKRLYAPWAGLKPRIACRTTFWGYVTWQHIREGRIESSYLASNGASQAGGAARIERALSASEEEAPRRLDDCVRTVLRRLGGLPEARGNRTVYVNCPFARSWWRERFVRETSGGDSSLEPQVREVIIKQEYWERLVLLMVSRNSVFGSSSIRAALVQCIGAHIYGKPDSPLRQERQFLRPACRTLSTLQASRELSTLPAGDIRELVENVVAMHLKALGGQNSQTPATSGTDAATSHEATGGNKS